MHLCILLDSILFHRYKFSVLLFVVRAFSSLDICSFIFLHRVCRPSVNHSPPFTVPAISVIIRNGGSVAEGLACRLTAKNQDQLRNPIRSVIEYGLPLPFLHGGVLTSNIALLIFALSAGKIRPCINTDCRPRIPNPGITAAFSIPVYLFFA